jgi:hypothetical protein
VIIEHKCYGEKEMRLHMTWSQERTPSEEFVPHRLVSKDALLYKIERITLITYHKEVDKKPWARIQVFID